MRLFCCPFETNYNLFPLFNNKITIYIIIIIDIISLFSLLFQYAEPVDFTANNNDQFERNFHWYDQTLVNSVNSNDPKTHNFFRLLALCHTVIPQISDNRLEYQAQSPDEAALVSAARNFGFVFQSRTPLSITIQVKGQTEVNQERERERYI